SVVRVAVAEVDEEAGGIARVHPGGVLVRAVIDLDAVLPEALDARADVLALEVDQVDALAVSGEEPAHGLRGVRRLEQLDVADSGRQDRVLEAELLGLRAAVDRQAEDARVALDGRAAVPDDHRPLHAVAP